jgi:hypothetical protein
MIVPPCDYKVENDFADADKYVNEGPDLVKLQSVRVIIDCKLISVSDVRNSLLKETDCLSEVQIE